MVSGRPKRCWNCGFLYALWRSGRTARDAVVDPDELRNEEIMDKLTRISHGSLDSSDTEAAALAILEKLVSGLPYDAADGQPALPRLKDIISFQCLRQELKPLMLGFVGIDEITKTSRSPREQLEYITEAVQITAKRVLKELYETERTECGYFPYHPGFPAHQHSELQLDRIRADREEAFKQLAIQVQASLTGQSIEQQRKANLLTLGLLIVAAVSLALSLTSILISILIATGRLS